MVFTASTVTDKATTGLAGSIPEVWSRILNSARENNLVFVPLFDHRFEAEQSGTAFDTVHVDGADNFGAATAWTNAETPGLPLTAEEANYVSQVDISINRHYYKAFAVTHDAEILTQHNVLATFAEKAGYEISREMDAFAAGFPDNFSQSVGTLATPLDDEEILRGVQYLNDANAPFNDRFLVISAAEDTNLKKIERYTNSDYERAVGSLPTDRENGFVGRVHGLDIYMSTNVEGSNAAGHDNAIFQREAVAVVAHESMRVEGPSFDLESDSTEYVAHSFYGMQEMRDDHGVFAKGL